MHIIDDHRRIDDSWVPLDVTALSTIAFLPGDLLKAALATVLAVALHRAYPRAFPVSAGAHGRAVRTGAVPAQ